MPPFGPRPAAPASPATPPPARPAPTPEAPTMGRKKTRRQPHRSAWHWQQTDCWYYTPPGTKKRVPLRDLDGRRVRGPDNKQAAQLALARVRLAGDQPPADAPAPAGEWLVARVCSEYLQYCGRGLQAGTVSRDHHDGASRVLNDLCRYCGALPVAQLKKGHVSAWVDGHDGWKSPATRGPAVVRQQPGLARAEGRRGLAHGRPAPEAGLGPRPGAPPVHLLQRPAHVRAPPAVGLLERRGGLLHRDAGGAIGGHAAG